MRSTTTDQTSGSTRARRSLRSGAALALGAAVLASMMACSGAETAEVTTTVPAYTVVRPGTAGETLPAPTGDVILTISGAVSAPNVGDRVELDLATLETLEIVEYTTPDLQAEGGVVTFSGVLLSDLLDAAGVSDPTTLTLRALNDYAVEIPVDDLALPVLVATTADGERMGVERFGPTRIVYPYGTVDLDPALYDPRWIWQLSAIEVD